MNFEEQPSFHFLFDIDGTLTRYRTHALDRLYQNNFLFPLICDFAVQKGYSRNKCEGLITEVMHQHPYWDYPDFIQHLKLPMRPVLELFRKWHRENLDVYPDTIYLIRKLQKKGITISIISNNPLLGCLLKLECCGFADALLRTSCFRHILSTDLVHGCKNDRNVWKRAVEHLCLPENAVSIMVGDNLLEDGILPGECNIDFSYILNRENKKESLVFDRRIFQFSSAMEIAEHFSIFFKIPL